MKLINPLFLKFNKVLFFSYLCFLSSSYVYTQQLAFPSAKGAGAYTTGGRGGMVLKVTNLNDEGAGSLRAALMTPQPRIIVFDVSGTIQLKTIIELGIDHSNFTVAGQTAPEGGITITGRPIQMGGGFGLIGPEPCHNAIWRYIRFRNGSFTGVEDEYLHNGFISTGTKDLILDHCSFSFCDDQAISMNPDYDTLKHVTIQHCLFSENATGIVYGANKEYPAGDLSVHYNLFVDQGHRTPNIGGTLRFDIINNVCFNWQARLTSLTSGAPLVNYIGNYLQVGTYYAACENVVEIELNQNIYTSNNYHPIHYPIPQENDHDLWKNYYTKFSLPSTYFADTIFAFLGHTPKPLSPTEAYELVLSDVGANKYLNEDGSCSNYLDAFDATKIANVAQSISSNPHNKDWILPDLPTQSRPSNYDSNNDGIPDRWKSIRGFAPQDDLSSHVWESGYVGIEEFINSIDLIDSITTTSTIPPKIDLDQPVLKVYPNPSSTQSFNIEISERINILKLEVLNLNGKVVYQNKNPNITQIQLQHLANGLYFILVHTELSILKEEIIISQ